MNDSTVTTRFQNGELRDAVRNSPVDRAQRSGVEVAKTTLLYLYLIRFPLLTMLAVWPGLHYAFQTALFRGLADLESGGNGGTMFGIFAVSAMALFTVLTAVVSANLVLLYGDIRLNGDELTNTDIGPNLARRFFVFIPGVVVYLLFAWSLWSFNKTLPDFSGPEFLIFTSLGSLAAVLAVFFSNWLSFRWAESRGKPVGAFLAIPFDVLLPSTVRVDRHHGKHGLFVMAYQKKRPTTLEGRLIWQVFSKLAGRVGVGYVGFDKYGKPAYVLPGQLFAVALLLISLAVYFIAGTVEYTYLNGMSWSGREHEWIPTVAWVLGALGLICWFMTAVSFLWDRYRTPSLLVTGVVLLLISTLAPADHFYDVGNQSDDRLNALRTPREFFQERFKDKDRIILVAAAGGGIQAAAWTTQVLTGLQDDTRLDANKLDLIKKDCDVSNNQFDPSVAAISGVSGGSVGTLFYLRTLHSLPKPLNQCEARDYSVESGLEAAAWGLVFPDFQGVAFPLPLLPWHGRDRGWALERSIAAHANLSGVTMGGLGQAVANGLTTVLFNATMVSGGEPVVFSNTRFPSARDDVSGLAQGVKGFFELCGNHDLKVETAVRLSATFPVVSPAARSTCNSDHFVDGGYYDNYGLSTLYAWIRQALAVGSMNPVPESEEAKKHILIIRVTGFPPDGEPQVPPQSLTYQLYAPFLAIYNVRGKGQALHNDSEFWALQTLLRNRGVDLRIKDFQYKPVNDLCANKPPPLSWHLTRTEINCIRDTWNNTEIDEARATVRNFLK